MNYLMVFTMLPLVSQDEDPRASHVLFIWILMECFMRFAESMVSLMRTEKESDDYIIMHIYLDERKQKRNMKIEASFSIKDVITEN